MGPSLTSEKWKRPGRVRSRAVGGAKSKNLPRGRVRGCWSGVTLRDPENRKALSQSVGSRRAQGTSPMSGAPGNQAGMSRSPWSTRQTSMWSLRST